jgi:acetyl-CoA carboxylase biotin carboxyl carrier protein
MTMKDVKFGLGRKSEGIDADAIRALAQLLTETNLTEIEIENGGGRIRVSRQASNGGAHYVTAPAAPSAPATGEAAKPAGPPAGAVTSPMVGTIYVSPQPGAAAFVKVGDTIKEGDTLLIVEAMKTMNPITAPRSGKIVEICVVDAQPVEFGQVLVVIT